MVSSSSPPRRHHAKKKGGTKRSRSSSSSRQEATDDRSMEQQVLSYCRRLLHQCRKDLHKNAKVCKNFECQKMIRKIKLSSSLSSKEQQDSSNNQQNNNHKNDQKLREWRELSLDHVLNECFRRLGVLDLLELEAKSGDAINAPSKKSKKKVAKEAAKEGDDKEVEDETFLTTQRQAIERVLQHKRMREAIERWSQQVTEYRRWCSRHTAPYDDVDVESIDEEGDEDADSGDKKKSRQQERKRKRKKASKRLEASRQKEEDAAFVDASHSVFATLGDDARQQDNKGYGDHDDAQPKTKKNRAGQKARRAKAQAMEARRQGRTVDHSANWRERKKDPPQQQDGSRLKEGTDRHGEQHRSEQLKQQQRQPNLPPEKEELHPSWEARKTQKPNIVAFQGKKITFD